MRLILLTLALMLGLCVPADAGLVTVSTMAGNITVNASIAPKMTGFVNDAWARGFRGPVHCWSAKYDKHGRRTHVEHSRHYSGNACDFAQRRLKGHRRIATHRVMYQVADLAKKWGLRDGCTFRDCGHVDDGVNKSKRGRGSGENVSAGLTVGGPAVTDLRTPAIRRAKSKTAKHWQVRVIPTQYGAPQ